MSRLSFRKAISLIVLSSVPLVGVIWMRLSPASDTSIEGLRVKASAPVPVHWVAEVLSLSVESLPTFSTFDCKAAGQRLVATQVVERARVKCQKPHLLTVDLVLREPVAEIGDFPHVGVDQSGHLFPLDPLFADRRLPLLFLGEHCPDPPLGADIDPTFLTLLEQDPSLQMLDVSQARASSLGQKQIVIEKRGGDLIRFLPEKIDLALECYKKLPDIYKKQPCVVDLRLAPIAFLRPREK